MNCHKRIFTLLVLITVIAWGWMAGLGLAADNRGQGVTADALPKELKNVGVKDYFIPGKTKEAGVIQTAMGHVIVARGDLRQAYFAANGDKVYEQDIVFTLKAAKCRIKLINNDVITMGDRTRIAVKEVAGETNKAEKKTNLSMAQGKAMFYAIRVLSQKGAAMTVESPTSVAGVRGTKFGMEVTLEGEDNTASLPLLLADTSSDWGRHLILAQAPGSQRQGPAGPSITTTVHGFDGTVTVTSTVDGRTQSVGAGQTVSATPQGVGAIMPTPPQVAQRFQAATDVPPPAGSGSGSGGSSQSSGSSSSSQSSGSSSGNAPDEKKSSDNTGTSNTNNPDTSNVTQQQNVNKEEQQQSSTTTTTAKQYKGYVVGMLQIYSSSAYWYNNTYMSTSLQDFNQAGVTATTNDGLVNVSDTSGSTKYMTKLEAKDYSTPATWTGSKTVTYTKLGSNDYMEWGTWTQPGIMTTSDGSKYAYPYNGAYVLGSPTTDSEMATLKSNAIVGNYSGTSWGTYYTSQTATNLTGTFSGTVNFASQSVSNFNVNVSGSGKSFAISGASGSFSGGTSNFTINSNTGTWQFDGTCTATPSLSGANGTVYGNDASKGNYIGGVYKAANGTSSSNKQIVGGFQGSK